jgi:hypothetical protein
VVRYQGDFRHAVYRPAYREQQLLPDLLRIGW